MSNVSPASILYDAAGNAVAVLDDSGVRRLRTESKLATGHGLATEATLVTVKADTARLDVNLSTRVAEATFTGRVGEVQASPTANTVLGRLKDLYDAIVARLPAALVGGRLDTNVGAWLGSTAPTVGQKTAAASLPVALASDLPMPLSTDRVITGTITALDGTVEIDCSGGAVASVQITGTWVGTIAADATINGIDWFPIVGYLAGDAQTAIASGSINGSWRAVVTGFAKARVRATAWTSGTANVAGRVSAGASVVRANIGQTAYVSEPNSTTTPLGIGGAFTGTPDICISTMGIQVNAYSDQDSASGGLRVEQSTNGVDWDIVDTFTVFGGEGFSRTIQSTATYVRVVYTNNGVAQTTFRLQTVLVPIVEALPRSTGRNGGLISEPSELPTFTVIAPDVVLGNNKSMLSLCLASGNPRAVRLREVWIRNSQTSAVTGVVTTFALRRITGHSAGSTLTPVVRDSLDTLHAGITARTGATVSGEGGVEQRVDWSSDEWGAGTLDVEAHQVSFQNTFPAFRKHDPQTKPPTIRGGEGYHVKCATNSTAGSFDLIFVFTVEK